MKGLRRAVAPFSLGFLGALLATALVLGVVVSLPLWDWRPVDVRRVAVVFREALPVYAVLAAAVALINAWTHNPGSVIVGPAAPRGAFAILARQVLVTWGAVALPTLVVLIPCVVRAAGAPVTAGDALAIVTFFPALLLVMAIAHLAAIVVPFPVAWVTTLPLCLAATVIPVVIDDNLLRSTAYSTLVSALTWGSTGPIGASGFVAATKIFRILFFASSALCAMGATVQWASPFHGGLSRVVRGATWVVVPVAVAIGAALLQVPAPGRGRGDGARDPQGRVEACVFGVNAPLLPDVIVAAASVIDQVPGDGTDAVLVTESGVPGERAVAPFSSSLPESRQEFVSLTAEQVAAGLAGSVTCNLNSLNGIVDEDSDWERSQAALALSDTLLHRAGYDAPGPPATALADLSAAP